MTLTITSPTTEQLPELTDLLALWKPGKASQSASFADSQVPRNLPARISLSDGIITGMISGHHRFRHWQALADFRELEGTDGSWLAELFVHPDHRRAGVGRALVEDFIAQSEQYGCSMVVVRPDASDDAANQAGRQDFFRAVGFEQLRLDETVRFLPEWLMGRMNPRS